MRFGALYVMVIRNCGVVRVLLQCVLGHCPVKEWIDFQSSRRLQQIFLQGFSAPPIFLHPLWVCQVLQHRSILRKPGRHYKAISTTSILGYCTELMFYIQNQLLSDWGSDKSELSWWHQTCLAYVTGIIFRLSSPKGTGINLSSQWNASWFHAGT